ncbi:YHS domain-containing protein [Acidobacteriota bacterium]
MLQGLFRLLFYAFLAFIIYQIIRFFQIINKAGKTPRSTKQLSNIMVKDSTCNTYLPKEDAIKEIYEGKEYYFCSKECQQKFLASKKAH